MQQLVGENYLRWDSLGEFLALAESLRHMATTTDNPRSVVLADTLDRATERLLNENRSPARKACRSTTAAATTTSPSTGPARLARQSEDAELGAAFAPIAAVPGANEDTITAELIAVQGHPADIGGYYRPDADKASAVMRPSKTFNEALATLRTAPDPTAPRMPGGRRER